jgi:hypothetical protein
MIMIMKECTPTDTLNLTMFKNKRGPVLCTLVDNESRSSMSTLSWKGRLTPHRLEVNHCRALLLAVSVITIMPSHLSLNLSTFLHLETDKMPSLL